MDFDGFCYVQDIETQNPLYYLYTVLLTHHKVVYTNYPTRDQQAESLYLTSVSWLLAATDSW